MGRAGRTLDEDAVALLVAHEWPGNIRELINIVRRMLVMTTGTRLTAADVPAKLQQAHSTFVDDEDSFTGKKARMNLEFEQTYIDSLVRTCKGMYRPQRDCRNFLDSRYTECLNVTGSIPISIVTPATKMDDLFADAGLTQPQSGAPVAGG